MQAKKRIVKDYDKLPEEIINKLKIEYPRGYVKHLVKYTNASGLHVSALPYETKDIYYLIRKSATEARQIISDDDDYEDGILREDFGDDGMIGVDKDVDSLEEEEEEGSYEDPEMDEDEDDED